MSIDRSSSTGPSAARAFAAISLTSIVAGSATVGCDRATPPPIPALRLSLAPPAELVTGDGSAHQFGLALSPDGRRLAFSGTKDGATHLWQRDLTGEGSQALPGTSNGVLPFWSPDGAALAFFADGKLRALRFDDRSVHDLADAASAAGGTWHPNDDILFSPGPDTQIFRRRRDGVVEPFTELDPAESSHRHPRVVNDGRHVIFFVRSREATRQGVWIAPYDRPAARQRLINSDAHGLVVDSALLYSSDGALVAQRLDVDAATLVGRPLLVGTDVGRGREHELFAVAAADLLVFGRAASGLRELRWVDRAGAVRGALGEPMTATDVRVAPRGAMVAVARAEPQLKTLDIWTYDIGRPLPRRLSVAIDSDDGPVWSPDGAHIAWVTGGRAVTTRDARGDHAALRQLRTFTNSVRVTDWSADSQWLIVSEMRPEHRSDLLLLPLHGKGEPRVYAQSPFNESQGVVSPDGRWMAYASDESGRFEVYVDAFPTPGRRAKVTVGGGSEPRWHRNELYFRRGNAIHAARLALDGATPEALSSERLFDAGAEIRSYDVTPDGQRFLLNLAAPDSVATPMTVIVNVGSLFQALPSIRR